MLTWRNSWRTKFKKFSREKKRHLQSPNSNIWEHHELYMSCVVFSLVGGFEDLIFTANLGEIIRTFQLSWSHHLVLYIKEVSLNLSSCSCSFRLVVVAGGGWALQYIVYRCIQDTFFFDCLTPRIAESQMKKCIDSRPSLDSKLWPCGLEPSHCVPRKTFPWT